MPRHVVTCPLRWSDMDSAGHVHNVMFLRYLEEARIDMVAVPLPETGERALVGGIVVAEQEIEYLRPLRYRAEPVRVETWVTRIGNSSFTLAYEVRDDRHCYARASSTVVAFDLAGNRSRPLADTERALLGMFLSTTGDADCAASGTAGSAPDRATTGARR